MSGFIQLSKELANELWNKEFGISNIVIQFSPFKYNVLRQKSDED